jgi:hypothetical protein
MADIKNYTLNFVSGRPRGGAALTCAARTLASNEIQLRRRDAIAFAMNGHC